MRSRSQTFCMGVSSVDKLPRLTLIYFANSAEDQLKFEARRHANSASAEGHCSELS